MKKLKILFTSIAAFFVIIGVLFIFIYNGSDSVSDYIDSISKVETRQLNVYIDDSDGYYTIQNDSTNSPFKILQLSDVHFGSSALVPGKDRLALEAVYNLIYAARPDLVVLTGDILYPSFFRSGSINNEKMVQHFGRFMENIGVYWAPIFGNHDGESFARLNKNEIGTYYETFDHCLFQKGSEEVDGVGNYIIKLCNNDGSLNTALFLMDSQSYYKGNYLRYDIIHDNQVEWYENSINSLDNPQSLLYIHIPMKVYKTAWNLYEEDSPLVSFDFGSKPEKIHCPKEDGLMWDKIVELESTKAVFCGHDHSNNFGITYLGVQLVYTPSIDYTAYPLMKYKTAQRGGTLVYINSDKSYRIAQLYQDNNYLEESST